MREGTAKTPRGREAESWSPALADAEGAAGERIRGGKRGEDKRRTAGRG